MFGVERCSSVVEGCEAVNRAKDPVRSIHLSPPADGGDEFLGLDVTADIQTGGQPNIDL